MVFKILDKTRNVLNKRLKEVDAFFKRCRKHAAYYKTNNNIVSVYVFVFRFYKEYKKLF